VIHEILQIEAHVACNSKCEVISHVTTNIQKALYGEEIMQFLVKKDFLKSFTVAKRLKRSTLVEVFDVVGARTSFRLLPSGAQRE